MDFVILFGIVCVIVKEVNLKSCLIEKYFFCFF